MKKNIVGVFLLLILFLFPLSAKDKEETRKKSLNDLKIIHYSLKVNIKPELRYLSGNLKIDSQRVKEAIFILDKRAMISRVQTNNKDTRIRIIKDINKIKKMNLNYQGNFDDLLKKIKFYIITLDDEKDNFSKLIIDYKIIYRDYRNNNMDFPFLTARKDNGGIINRKGVFLVSGSYWYPYLPGPMGTYKLKVDIDKPYSVVSEGEMKIIDNGLRREFTFNVFYPIEFLDLVGGDYVINEEKYKGIKIGTYFSFSDSKYSNLYIDKTKKFLDLYQNIFTPYPFTKFLVVENFLQTGYGMPSFTLLGYKVIPLPFIVSTSLGHEILHNWWGNSVYVDYSNGNWCEGLTVLYADYLYSEQRGKGKDYRFQILKDYYSYVNRYNEISIKDFISKKTTAEGIIGYGKSMMFFYMLRNIMGKESFEKALKDFATTYRFKKASFLTIEKIMEKYYKKDLSWFFKQWVERKGAVKLKMELLSKVKKYKGYTVEIRIFQLQEGPSYILDIPTKIVSEDGESIKYNIRVNKKVQNIKFVFNKNPISVQLDPDYEIFRELYKTEVPPSISLFLGNNPVSFKTSGTIFSKNIKDNFPNKNKQTDIFNKIIINPPLGIIKTKLEKAGVIINNDKIKINDFYYDIKDLSIILTDKEGENFYLLIYSSNYDFPDTIRKITHYGKYGILIWDKDLNLIDKISLKSISSPLKIDLTKK